jgi:hypothetical protein
MAPVRCLVVGEGQLRLGFLDLHQLAELGGLHRFALADRLRVRFEEAERLVRVVGVAGEDPGPRLGQDPPNQASGLLELLRQALDLELREPHCTDRACRDVLHGAVGLPYHRSGVSHELPVERAHARLHQILARPPAQLHDREDSAGHAPRPIAQRHDAVGHCGAEPLQRPGQHADAIRQEGAVGRIVDVRLDHGRVDAQPPPAHDAPLAGDHHQARQKRLQRRAVEDLGEPDQGLRVGDAFALDAAEGSVDEVGPDLALALVKASVEQMREHKHPEDDGGRGPGPAATLTERMAPAERLHHHVEQALVLQLGADTPKHGVPQLLAVGQQHLDKAPLGVCETNHEVSGGSEEREPGCLVIASTDISHDHHPTRRMESTKMRMRPSFGPGHPPLGRPNGVSSAPESACPERQTCSVGRRPTGVRARHPVAWMAGRRETEALKPIDDAVGRDGERVAGP